MTTHDSARAGTGRHAAVRDREDAVVARLQALSTAVDGEPDPQFRAATRARLVAMAAVRSPAPAPRPWFRRVFDRAEDRAPSAWRARLTAGLAGAAVAVTACAALFAVAGGAKPGDALYALKRGTEQTQLALASDSTRGRTLLDFASTRLHELQELSRSGNSAAAVGPAAGGATVLAAGPSSSLVLDTIGLMDRQTTQGTYWVTTQALRTHDTAALAGLAGWVDRQAAGLRALAPNLPSAAGPATQQALALLGNVAARNGALQPSLTCPSGPATAGSDALGPIPSACAAATSGGVPGGSSVPQQNGGVGTSTSTRAPDPNQPAGGGLPLPNTAAPTTGAGGLPGGLPGVGTAPAPGTTTNPLPLPPLTSVVPSLGLPGTSASSPSSGGTPLPSVGSILPTCVPLVTC